MVEMLQKYGRNKMDDKLKDIFENVNNWLKFAEAKNATLIAGNGLVIFAIAKLLKDLTVHQYLIYYAYFVIIVLGLSFCIALSSFIPNIKLPKYLFKEDPETESNLLFFGSIQKYDERSYLKELKESLDINDEKVIENKFNLMYAQQIIINSKIAMKKYKLFDLSLHLTLFAILSPVLYFIYWVTK